MVRRRMQRLSSRLVWSSAVAVCIWTCCRPTSGVEPATSGAATSESVPPSSSRISPPPDKVDSEKNFQLVSLQGRVVWLAEAMEKRLGVKSPAETREQIVAIETRDGRWLAILEDVRGRAFRKDERLRGVDVELLVRRYDGSPLVRVLGVYSLEKSGKFELDYWCDVCAIAMYELKPCECCQGDIELRRRPAR